jgi:hypothetical protein
LQAVGAEVARGARVVEGRDREVVDGRGGVDVGSNASRADGRRILKDENEIRGC